MGQRREGAGADPPRVSITRQTLREAGQVLRYVRPYWPRLSAALLCSSISSLLGLAFPYLAGNLVDATLQNLEHAVPQNWLQDLNRVTLGLIVVLALRAAFTFLRTLWFIEVGERTLADLRRDIFARLVRMSMTFHGAHRVGELSSRLTADLALTRAMLVDGLPHLLRQAELLVGGVTLIAMTSLRLTTAMLASVPVLMIVGVLFGGLIRRVARRGQDCLAESNVIVEETLQNIASVKAFANEPCEEKRYRRALDVYLQNALRGAYYEGGFISFVLFALFGSGVLLLWYGARLVLAGELSAGNLTRFLLFTVYVSGAVGSFAGLYGQVQRMFGATTRLRELLREAPEPCGGAVPALHLRGDVRFEAVEFSYPSRSDVPVLKGVSLEIRAGQRIALVGSSGAGKSTMVSLLLRFHDPGKGRILIDGRDAREYELRDLRMQMAVVPQDVILFGDSIAENIAYGRPGATQAEIEEAARQANAHAFIRAFPNGYQTVVGERGVQLSGGQRQRVAIARAILRDPAILLLDEATNSLDSENESLVFQALDRLMRGRTALVIAHRLSTVRGADCIYVLKEGTVAESGRHTELMQRPNGLYRNLSLLQWESDRASAYVKAAS